MRQVAALPYIRSDNRFGVEVLLITSRRTGRWIIPKGNLDHGVTPAEMVAVEAFEEAGVAGKVEKAIGSFTYLKVRERSTDVMLSVPVYPLRVEVVHHQWPEQDERERRWFSPDEAARLVEEDSLGALLLDWAAGKMH